MKITCIFLNDKLANLYINSGQYPYKVAKEMKVFDYSKIEVKEFYTDLTDETLIYFLYSHIENEKPIYTEMI